jgi:hypothetical protein
MEVKLQVEVPGYTPNEELNKYTFTYQLMNGREGQRSVRAIDEWAAFCSFVDWMGDDCKFMTGYQIECKPGKFKPQI